MTKMTSHGGAKALAIALLLGFSAAIDYSSSASSLIDEQYNQETDIDIKKFGNKQRAVEEEVQQTACNSPVPKEIIGAPIPFPPGSVHISQYNDNTVGGLLNLDAWENYGTVIQKAWVQYNADDNCDSPTNNIFEFSVACLGGSVEFLIYIQTGDVYYNTSKVTEFNACYNPLISTSVNLTQYGFTVPCECGPSPSPAPTSFCGGPFY